MFASAYPKLRSWLASVASPSSTHASGMLILLGILAAVTEASVKEPIRVHHPKVHPASSSRLPSEGTAEEAEAKALNSQEMLYYVAMGMLVSQGLIRLLTFISNRREAAATGAAKKDDDLRRGKNSNGDDDLDDLEEKRRRAEHLAALGDNASLLGSDSEDEDYEEESESESESEDEEEEDESENESEIESRRHVLIAGDAVIEE
ncbi:hypothetical protein BC939DRAFT_463379 [Gamsiella multidivaricata]|uniref:uncharacterized protein n=1 Tax=Gamsiella multidivaricata TaxID=101098 RepID=UPI00221ECFA7|nr:uncharacterized protein BC939DRAFT_463379 [Gamsiella multidivaricata]KAG0360670.1 hypothetical protein BGZ54_009446 [Gamsiella multidivaricata]KAI7818352.1 hypothetical protein BC939DRAFT_463379 [Gamsiella multidivaricata]